MFREYAPLRWSALRSVSGVRVAPLSPPARVTLDSPALEDVCQLGADLQPDTFAQTFAEIEGGARALTFEVSLTRRSGQSYTGSTY